MSPRIDPRAGWRWTAGLILSLFAFFLPPIVPPQYLSPAPVCSASSPPRKVPATGQHERHRHPGDGWVASGAYWDLRDSIFSVQGLFPTAKAYYAPRTFRNFVYEVRIAKLAENGATGLIFRYDDVRDEGYEIHIWPSGGFAVAKFVGANKKDFASGPPSHFKKELNTWNTVKVEGRTSRFDFFVNGFHVCTASDPAFARGKLGLLMPGDARQRAKFQILVMDDITSR